MFVKGFVSLGIIGAVLVAGGVTAPDWLRTGVVAHVGIVSNDYAKAAAKLPVLAKAGITVVALYVPDVPDGFVAAARAAGLRVVAPYRVARDETATCSAWDFYGVDTTGQWSGTYEAILKARQSVSDLTRLWTQMKANRPAGRPLLRGSPHWDPVPIALVFALDGIPVLSPGQESCCRAVLPKLCALRAAEPALTEGTVEWLASDRPDEVAAFVRTAPDGRRLACVFNLRRKPLVARVDLPGTLGAEPLLQDRATVEKNVYTFANEGYDIRVLDGTTESAERAARARAIAGAKEPRARNLVMKDPEYRADRSKWVFTNCTAQASPAYLKGAVMYQLFLRMFTPEGTLRAARERLGFVRALGTDIVYLCPVVRADRGEDRRFWSARQKASRLDNPANPYRIADFFAVDPEYGDERDVKDFVAEAHRLGMKVYFDLVYYHCGPNAVFLRDRPEWVLHKPDGSFDLGQWAFPRFDVKNPEVREYFFENMKWYLTEFDADGFRCDVGEMLPLWYREEALRRNREVKADVVMLDEGHDPRDQQAAFHLDYCYRMQWAIRDMLKGVGSATNLSNAVVNLGLAKYPKGYRWMRCFQNHDFANCAPGVRRYEALYGPDANDAMLATIFTLDGVPMLYNGQEIADTAPHSIWSDRDHGKWGIDWSAAFTKTGERRLALVKALAKLRHEHPALFDAPTEFLETERPAEVYAYRRRLPDGSSFVTAVNISAGEVTVKIPAGLSCVLSGPNVRLAADGTLTLAAKNWIVAKEEVKSSLAVPEDQLRRAENVSNCRLKTRQTAVELTRSIGGGNWLF